MELDRANKKNVFAILAIMSAVLVLTGLSASHGIPAWKTHQAMACGRCWHVTPGSTYPAQFNDNDLGQVVKMSCTVLTNNGHGAITTSCLEQ